MLRLTTAGESHGPGLTAILEGLPAGLSLSRKSIDAELRRRQLGYGRGGRMRIERDRAQILGGVRFGRTLGSPISIWIPNRDFESWREAMDVWKRPADPERIRRVTRPRPGHADLAGALKYNTHDARDVLERASARETAARVAAGSIARALLRRLGVSISSHTVRVGVVCLDDARQVPFEAMQGLPETSPLRCVDRRLEKRMIAEIDAARRGGDTVGGAFQVVAKGAPPGLGSAVSAERRLDGRIAGGFLTIPAVKGVSIGQGVAGASARGSVFHDEIFHRAGRGFFRRTNRAGGLEGGVTTGQEVRVTAYMKPLSTLARPLKSADLVTKRAAPAAVERADTIPIVAAGVIGEAVLALVLADAALEKFGGDAVRETVRNWRAYRRQVERF